MFLVLKGEVVRRFDLHHTCVARSCHHTPECLVLREHFPGKILLEQRRTRCADVRHGSTVEDLNTEVGTGGPDLHLRDLQSGREESILSKMMENERKACYRTHGGDTAEEDASTFVRKCDGAAIHFLDFLLAGPFS